MRHQQVHSLEIYDGPAQAGREQRALEIVDELLAMACELRCVYDKKLEAVHGGECLCQVHALPGAWSDEVQR